MGTATHECNLFCAAVMLHNMCRRYCATRKHILFNKWCQSACMREVKSEKRNLMPSCDPRCAANRQLSCPHLTRQRCVPGAIQPIPNYLMAVSSKFILWNRNSSNFTMLKEEGPTRNISFVSCRSVLMLGRAEPCGSRPGQRGPATRRQLSPSEDLGLSQE